MMTGMTGWKVRPEVGETSWGGQEAVVVLAMMVAAAANGAFDMVSKGRCRFDRGPAMSRHILCTIGQDQKGKCPQEAKEEWKTGRPAGNVAAEQ